jgi:hypothetical protein
MFILKYSIIAFILSLSAFSSATAVERTIYHARACGDTLTHLSGDQEGAVFCFDDDCYCDVCYGSYIDRIDNLWPARKNDAWLNALTHYNDLY